MGFVPRGLGGHPSAFHSLPAGTGEADGSGMWSLVKSLVWYPAQRLPLYLSVTTESSLNHISSCFLAGFYILNRVLELHITLIFLSMLFFIYPEKGLFVIAE